MVPLLMCSGFKTYAWYSDRDELYIYVASRFKSRAHNEKQRHKPTQMKQGKLAVFEKELSAGYFHVKTTVILSMSIALLVFLLGMFIIIIFLRNGVFIIDPTKL